MPAENRPYQKMEASQVFGEIQTFPVGGLPFELPISIEDFHRVTTQHRRSLESEVIDGKVLWADEFGNRFTALSFKGLPLSGKVPRLERDPNFYGDLRTHFLVHHFGEDSLEFVNTVSADLREQGLGTEVIVQLRKIEEIDYYGERILVADLKERMLADFMKEQSKVEFVKSRVSEETARAYLDEVSYYEVVRTLPIAERIRDIPEAFSGKDAASSQRFLKSLSTYFKGEYRGVNFENTPEGFFNYLTETLPELMGDYLGRFHKAGYRHNYASSHNWTASGELVDLDSVLPIQGDSFTIEDVKGDISQTLLALVDIYTYEFQEYCVSNGILPMEDIVERNRDILKEAFSRFTASYERASERTVGERFQNTQNAGLQESQYVYPYTNLKI